MGRMDRKLTKRKQSAVAAVVVLVCVAAVLWKKNAVEPERVETAPTVVQKTSQKKTDTETAAKQKIIEKKAAPKPKEVIQKATIMASGDMLYHDVVYEGAYVDEKYDFNSNYQFITPLISAADLALGDFEGTINPDRELVGYPIFNAPQEVVATIKNAGYDAISLAHNHILDTGISGLRATKKIFNQAGLDVFGIKTTADDTLLIKEVNGIKIALLGYSYGFNGLEALLSEEEYQYYLKDLDMAKVEREIKQAEKEADLTVVMPQAGVEYSLQPTEEQQTIYRQMIDFGADIIFGGHPHVAEPTEIVEKDGQRKFIIYSMGNLLSNQRYETLGNYWTERGVIPEVEVTKKEGQTVLSDIKLHPTWVSREPRGWTTPSGYQAYKYQVLLAEDYIKGGQYEHTLPPEKEKRIVTAYNEMLELLDLKWE